MKTKALFLTAALLLSAWTVRADETITVTATSTDISENLDLKTVATLFGQAENLEQFEQMLNNPDSAFSNLDLNGDGQVDYLRVIETADANKHLVVIQAVLAKDIYQDVASIYVEKDPETQSVTVQVIGDEYIYGTNYIIEPVYIYRPYIYDWFWGPGWVCWHSPYYWDYWPGWWHPYYCVAPSIYWDHCYWHHHHHPICSYRTGHRPHDGYRPMYEPVRRTDYAARHPERSFATRNATRGVSNARAFDAERRVNANARTVNSNAVSRTAGASATRSAARSSNDFGSANIRTSTSTTRNAAATTRTATTPSRQATTTRTTATPSRQSATATTRTTSTSSRSTTTTRSNVTTTTGSSPTRSSASYNPSPSRSSGSTMRSSSSGSTTRSSSSGSTMRSSSSGGGSRSGGGSYSSGGGSRSGGSSSRSGGSTRR